MGIFDDMNIRGNAFTPYINTGTQLDVATGGFVPGTKGEMILNGGLTYTNAVVGRPQMFKSTEAESFLVGAMQNCPGADGLVHDTETSLVKQRLVDFARPECREDVSKRLIITDHTEYKAEAFFELIKGIAAKKESIRRDITVETPFIDPVTGKCQTMMIPTFIGIDSWSKMTSDAVQEIYAKNEIGSSGTNMVYMKDGNVKTMMISQIPTLAVKYNIYFVFTAHIGDKLDLNPYAPSARELQHMKASDKIKNAGADFNFLVSNLIEARKAQVLQNDKDCLYPDKYSNAFDLNAVTSVICRCKGNVSGSQITPVVSQTLGILPAVSNYHYLKENDYFGLVGNKMRHAPCLSPDHSLGRTTVRDKLNDTKDGYAIARALELIAQFHYIRTNWNLRGVDVDFTMSPEKFAESLLKNSSYAIGDILNSRGYWTYNKADPRSYLSIYDVLAIISGKYKPKLISVSKK